MNRLTKCSYNNYYSDVVIVITKKGEKTMQSLRIGIRETKINLSKLLKNVQKGREIIITDRGKPVGKIVPMPSDSLPLAERINELEKQGLIESRKKKRMKKLLIPIPIPDGLAHKFLQEDRNL